MPLSTIAGTWVFTTDGFSFNNNRNGGQIVSSGGRFVASVGTDRAGSPLGVLALTRTAAVDGSITRLEAAAGRYQMNSDCTAGSLAFNAGSRPVQFDFWLVNGGEMVMVGSNDGDVITGTARLSAALTCQAPALQAILGTWVFSVEDFDLGRVFNPFFAAAGSFTASMVNGSGALSVTETAGTGDGNIRLEGDSGRISVLDDCSGGYLSFNVAGRGIQFDYFFANANRIVLAGTSGGDIVVGEARRFGSF